MFTPEQHYIRVNQRGTGNSVADYYGFEYHGVAGTHLDAFVHMWDRDGMWNGRDYSYGVALIDNTPLEPLGQACAEERRDEFMFMALPLKIDRGTGSPGSPIAMF